MAAPDNPQVVKIAMLFTRDTRTFVNTFHIQKTAAWTEAAIATACTLFATWMTSNYRGLIWSGVSLFQVQGRLYDPDNPLAFDLTLGTPTPGTVAGPPGPANMTLSASWRTGLAGRKYRGRFYTVGMTDAQGNDNDTSVSTYNIAAAAATSQLLSNLAAAGLSLVIFHRVDNTFTPVVSSIIEGLLDSQRRRLAGRGR